MRAVVQRVTRAQVSVDGQVVSKIDGGLCVLVGIGGDDGPAEVDYLARKLWTLRVFKDEDDRMNLGLDVSGGELLLVSQFTLYGDVRKGRRPSFVGAMEPGRAKRLFESLCERCESLGASVKRGIFGADMKVELVNDGPVTILLGTDGNF